MGTTEDNSRMKVLENTALQPSPSLQQHSCSDVRDTELYHNQDTDTYATTSLIQEPVQQHFFSKHDNRTSFDKGPYCLLQGIGRRKDLQRLWQRHTFLRWAPCELELSKQQPLESSYQSDFRTGPGLCGQPQRLVHFVQVRPPHVSTTYQQNFCQPSLGGHCGTNKSCKRESNQSRDLAFTCRREQELGSGPLISPSANMSSLQLRAGPARNLWCERPHCLFICRVRL
ncbi:uncharacterized protein CIMIP7 isoform X3 [Oryctolagus cuniculus]|uniref:uncharacterized protein CIMIP7 isoform X3 n=1 Tax=Oryctolagus cuniculus TaxID=9986 RepID=UPI00387A02D6